MKEFEEQREDVEQMDSPEPEGVEEQAPSQEDEFDRGYDDAVEEKDQGLVDYGKYQLPIGTKLQDLFNDAELDRLTIEQRWLKDLRQYKGDYDPEIKAALHAKRSKANMSLTRTKVKTVDARMMDILFPAGAEKNWGIEPTPVPELNPQLVQEISQQITEMQGGQVPSAKEIDRILFDEARARAEDMEKEMHDQLSEIKYREIIRGVVHSGNLYGTGILKGPMVKQNVSKRYVKQGDGWGQLKLTSFSPYAEFVPVWDIYPDMTASKMEDCRYVFQRHVMPKQKLFALSKREDFIGDAILAYIMARPDGDAVYKIHENDLQEIKSKGDDGGLVLKRPGKYEVIEFWGYMSVDELADVDIQIPEDALGHEVAVNVWMIDNVVIKAVLSPVEGVEIPYHFYHYDKDETSIFGEGIPVLMRDVQGLFNAAVRAMFDNAAISAGPLIEANVDLLASDEDPTDLFPFRVFQRHGLGSDAGSKAITVTTLPSYTAQFMELINFLMTTADDVTSVPRYMYGDTGQMSGTAGQTATGLSMLMGAAHITLKDQIKFFDDGITKPFIKSLYFWNMEFNDKPNLKGDFNIVARGTASLIAREVKSEQLNQLMALVMNEFFAPYINFDQMLNAVIKNLDLDDMNIVKDTRQTAIEDEQNAAVAQEDKAFEQDMAMMKASSGGHMNKGTPEGEAAQVTPPGQAAAEQGVIPDVQLQP